MDNIDEQKIKNHVIPEDLKLTFLKKKALRLALGSNTNIKDIHHALMKIKVIDILKIIREQDLTNENDILIFYLASYRTKADVDRYKKYKHISDEDAKDLKFKPTLLVAGRKKR